MIDPFLILAPVFLLAVVALLAFVGCDKVYGLSDTFPKQYFFRTNCGGPTVSDTDLGWNADLDPSPAGGTALMNDLDPNGPLAGTVYDTCRFGNGVMYPFNLPQAGTYTVTLKFAQITSNPNLNGPFSFRIDGGDPHKVDEIDFDVTAPDRAGGTDKAYDYIQTVAVTAAGVLTISFMTGSTGRLPFINAIEVTN